jgi:hypothetical protein
MNTAMSMLGSESAGNFLTSQENIDFSRTLLDLVIYYQNFRALHSVALM